MDPLGMEKKGAPNPGHMIGGHRAFERTRISDLEPELLFTSSVHSQEEREDGLNAAPAAGETLARTHQGALLETCQRV